MESKKLDRMMDISNRSLNDILSSDITTDAVASPPRPRENLQLKDVDTVQEMNPVPPQRRRLKKTIDTELNLTNNANFPESNDPFNPISVQSTGNVINIVNSRGIHWGPEIVYNFGPINKDKTTGKANESEIEKTKAIEALMESKDDITHKYMDIVSKQIGEGWRDIFRNMGYDDGAIEIFYETNYPKGISEVIYQILLDWIRSEDRTIGELCTFLWINGKRSLVQTLSVQSKKIAL